MIRERIVVIDDNANDAAIVRRLLERAQYSVRYASSGEEGLEILHAEQADCVLVDYRMPGMDGYEVCRRIKSDPALQNIPVLMLTGADSPRNLVEGFESGADDYVTKAAEFDVLLARVRALLRVKAYQDELRTHNQRLENDLRFARRVQEALLPEQTFQHPSAEIRSAYIPSETLSGDFYDYFEADRRLVMMMADVSGHGLPAAILVSLLKSFLHSEAPDYSPARFMERLNDFLCTASLPSQFATAQLFVWDAERSRLTVSNAAHPPFLTVHKQGGAAEAWERPGHLLGAMPRLSFEQFQVQVEPGDTLFAYTDGLTDRRNKAQEFYPLERIARLLEKHRAAPLADLYTRIWDDISAFSPTEEFRDDLAFTLVRFGENNT